MYNTRMAFYKKRSARDRKKARQFQQLFFAKAGPALALLKSMFDQTDYGMYVKDIHQRLVTLNRKNCELNNILDELDVVGKRSDEIFDQPFASDYMKADLEVIRTGKPVLNDISDRPSDLSGFLVRSVFPVNDLRGRIIGTACVYKKVADANVEGDWRGRMKSVLSWINAHFAEPISTESLAKSTGISASQFRRIFASLFGTSPTRYVNTVRINAARNLRETTDKLITDIAAETGFYDQSHFSRIFTRERGITPGAYRRQHRTS